MPGPGFGGRRATQRGALSVAPPPPPPPPPAPANTALPVITRAGDTLSVTNGSWANSPTSFARQWTRNGVAISGETGASYAIPATEAGASFGCTVTASNAAGAGPAASAVPMLAWPMSPYNALIAEAAASGVVADFSGNSFAWGGSAKTLANLTANADGSYELAFGSWWGGAATVLFDYAGSDSLAVSGTYFSWASGTSDRVEFDATTISGSPNPPRLYTAPGTPAASYANAQYQYPGQSATARPRGNQRFIATIQNGQTPRLQVSNNQIAPGGGNPVATLVTPTKLAFGRRARFNDQRLANATLHRVLIWPRVLSDAEIALLGRGPNLPVHLIGDSFLNVDELRGALFARFANRGYVPVTQDGVGGTSLAQQAVRLALNSVTTGSPSVTYDIAKWKQSTLVIMDGGLDDTASAAITAIGQMVALLPHNRWLYVEPAPSVEAGTPARIDWDARVAAIRAFVGEDRFVPTLAPALAAGNGGTADNAEIAKGLWPLSLKTSLSDFHPNAAGSAFIAGLIDARLILRGWVA